VRACHDLSDGGLAVAAAEMCIAGRLGLDLKIEAQDAAFTLFGSVNGCLLVEVPAWGWVDFEEDFSRLPCIQLGRVTPEPRLTIQVIPASGRGLSLAQVSLPVEALLAAWKPQALRREAGGSA